MVIEWLKFHVPHEVQDLFVEKDLAHWTQALAAQPGFVSKEVWTNPDCPEEIILVIRWRTHQQWKEICPQFLGAIEEAFRTAMGNHPYAMVETGEFYPHKLPHVHVRADA